MERIEHCIEEMTNSRRWRKIISSYLPKYRIPLINTSEHLGQEGYNKIMVCNNLYSSSLHAVPGEYDKILMAFVH